MKRIYEWWKQHVAHKSAEARKKHIEDIRRRYDIEVKDGNLWLTVSGETITNVPETWTTIDILNEREQFIAAAMKKEGLSNEA